MNILSTRSIIFVNTRLYENVRIIFTVCAIRDSKVLLTKSKYCCETHLSFAGDYWKKSILGWTNSKNLKHMPKLTVREIESFFEKSGKTGKTKKRADNLIFNSFLDNIECLNAANFFYI